MSSLQITLVAAAAVLFFWVVGAYNRLMELRNAILRRFDRFDEQFKLRHALLLSHLDAHVAVPPIEATGADAAPEALQALRAACLQTHSACAAARSRPAVAEAVVSLRLAEAILQGTIDRLPQLNNDPGGLKLRGQLSTSESAMQIARSEFNDAVHDYNLAVRQFPTCLLAGMLGFRAAAHL